MANKKTVTALLTTLEEIYTHREKLSDATIEIYCDLFTDIPDKLIIAATKQHIAQSKFFPSPYELLDTCRIIANYGNQPPPAILAWGEVQNKLTSYRCNEGKRLSIRAADNEKQLMAYTLEFMEHRKNCDVCKGKVTPEFSHPIIKATVEAIGWEQLRYSDNLMVDRAHFLKAYESLILKQKEDDVILPEIKQLASDMSVKKLTD